MSPRRSAGRPWAEPAPADEHALEETRALLAVARGDEPADLVLQGGKVVNVCSGEVLEGDVAIQGTRIAGVASGYEGERTVDIAGRYVAPGLIDAHVHVESSMVRPAELARCVVPRGVTTLVTDPHEIANVLGLDGIRFMIADAARAPMSMLVNAPSCVPATAMATSGAALDAAAVATLLDEPTVLGLAEVMNYPGVVAGDADVLAKIRAYRGRPVDGHCPGLGGKALNAYVAAGPSSDHEAVTADEALEKLRLGMYVFLREASNARNLADLLPLVTTSNARRVCLCTDDRQPPDLLAEGGVDHLVRMCIAAGVEPVIAIAMATLNPAEHFGLADRGAVAPGCRADLFVFDDLQDVRADLVVRSGEVVARDGSLVADLEDGPPAPGGNTVRVDWESVSLRIDAAADTARVIGVLPDQIVTEHRRVRVPSVAGAAEADPARDIAKIAVVERHGRGRNVGLGFVQGLGLTRGAIASTVAHDHHNLVVAGVDDASMLTAARAVATAGGGQAAAAGRDVLALVPLPVAGLLSEASVAEVSREMRGLLDAASTLGSGLHDPFMALSFLGLEVIPSLKLTDMGLVDVEAFSPVPLFVAP